MALPRSHSGKPVTRTPRLAITALCLAGCAPSQPSLPAPGRPRAFRITMVRDSLLPKAWQSTRPRNLAAVLEPGKRRVQFYVQLLDCDRNVHALAQQLEDTLLITIYDGAETEHPLSRGCFCGGDCQVLYRGATTVVVSHYVVRAATEDSLIALPALDRSWP
jgi:hypothetical protein